MGELPDFAKIYSNLYGTWDKIRVDLLSHAFVLSVVLLLSRGKLTHDLASDFDPSRVLASPYFKLAKESNLLLLFPLVVLVLVVVYGLLMRTIGRTLASVVMASLSPKTKNLFASEFVNTQSVATIASTLETSDFTESDLSRAFQSLIMRYAARKNSELDRLQKASPGDKDSFLYLGYSSAFLLIWFVLLILASLPLHRIFQSRRNYWLVGVFVFLFWLWSWLRTRAWQQLLAGSLVLGVALIAENDEDLRPQLAAARPRREEIYARITELRKGWRRARKPSLFRYLRSNMFSRSTPEERVTRHPRAEVSAWSGVLARGRNFGLDQIRNQRYDSEWLSGYAAYLFYRCVTLLNPIRLLGVVLGFVLDILGLSQWLDLQLALRKIRMEHSDFSMSPEMWARMVEAYKEGRDSGNQEEGSAKAAGP